MATLARLANEGGDGVSDDLDGSSLLGMSDPYRTVLDVLVQGVCLFDPQNRLILSNRRFMEIYGLTPEHVRPGTTLRELVDLRMAAGTWAKLPRDYLAFCDPNPTSNHSLVWTTELRDGRFIRLHRRPVAGGGCVVTHEDITELRAATAAADERLSLQTLIDRLCDNLWAKDINSRFILANQVTATRMGFASPADLLGRTDLDLLPIEIAEKFYLDEQHVVRTGKVLTDVEEYIFDGAGEKIWLQTTKVPFRNEHGEIVGVAGLSRDITERRLADALRDGQAEILEMITMSAPLGEVLEKLVHLIEAQFKGIACSILLLDETGTVFRNGAAPSLPEAYCAAIEGLRVGPGVGSCGTAAHRREAVVVADIMTDPLWVEFKDLAAAHGLRSCWATPILSHQGSVLGTFAIYSETVRRPTLTERRLTDVATRIAGIAIERRSAEDRIQFLANHDALTGLPNRMLLADRLSQAILHAQRNNSSVNVLFVDLDNFKYINDSLGHNAGDELLKIVARRMVGSVRASDTVARLGGDEFVVVLTDRTKTAAGIAQTVQRIQAAIAEPVHLGGHDLRVTGSIGIANYPDDGTDADALMANADAAMYRAKEIGRDNFQLYTRELNSRVHGRFLLQEDLRNAVARSELVLHYQPQIDLRSGRICAVEALVRWNHPRLGLIGPSRFIPMAEETGAIVALGDWVLREACRQNRAWQEAGLPAVTVSVNVSARQFKEKNLLDLVPRALRDTGLAADRLELELTESLIMQDTALTIATMNALRTLGVHLSIDDFGTGYSSLGALKTFPVERLKIDKSFIAGLLTDGNDKALVKTMISLARALQLRIVAEGVECEAQAALLREIECDEVQGYFFSKPVPPVEIEALLRSNAG